MCFQNRLALTLEIEIAHGLVIQRWSLLVSDAPRHADNFVADITQHTVNRYSGFGHFLD